MLVYERAYNISYVSHDALSRQLGPRHLVDHKHLVHANAVPFPVSSLEVARAGRRAVKSAHDNGDKKMMQVTVNNK